MVVVSLSLLMTQSMTRNAFEPLVWMGCFWCVLRAINTGESRYWLGFGAIAGIGFETKYSIAFFLLGVLIGVLLTPQRRFLKTRDLCLGALIALLIFLPNLILPAVHHFPCLDLIPHIRLA